METTSPTPALPVRFSASVSLTVHDAFLPTAGVLQCDAFARIQLVTVKRVLVNEANNSPSAYAPRGNTGLTVKEVTVDVKELCKTKSILFTSSPKYGETFQFNVQDNEFLTSLTGTAPCTVSPSNTPSNEDFVETIEDFIVISFQDGNLPATNDGVGAISGTRDYFLGEAYCPFSPHCASFTNEKVKVMLQPRHAFQNTHPHFKADTARLKQMGLDDFGYVTVSWEVRMIPHGGLLTTGTKPRTTDNIFQYDGNDHNSGTNAEKEVTFPLGLTLKTHWLVPSSLKQKTARFTTSVEFGGPDRFVFESNTDDHQKETSNNASNNEFVSNRNKPLFLTIKNMSQIKKNNSKIHFHCTLQNVVRPEGSEDVLVPVPLSVLKKGGEGSALNNSEGEAEVQLNPLALDRDVFWAAPVRSPLGKDYGILLCSVRLSRKCLEGSMPLCASHPSFCLDVNIPQHQEQFSHYMYTFPFMTGPMMPDCPLGAYQTLLWESEEHYSLALERKYKKSVLIEAQPRQEHIRHLFDVLMGRSYMDVNLLNVITAFFNKRSATEINLLNVKEFLIAAAFHVADMSVQEACRFCFIMLRRDVPDAIHYGEVVFLFENCLVGKTVEMPTRELRRYMQELFIGPLAYDTNTNTDPFSTNNNNNENDSNTNNMITYDVFHQYFVLNFGLWGTLGVPLRLDRRFSSEQRAHLFLGNTLTNSANKNVVIDAPQSNQSTNNSNNSGKGVMFDLSNNNNNNNVNKSAPQRTGSVGSNNRTVQEEVGTAANAANHPSDNNNNNNWRSFTVKVHSTEKRFAVTAHVNDRVEDVKVMLENTIHIKAARQKWFFAGTHNNNMVKVGSKELVGNTSLGLSSGMKNKNDSSATEVLIKEEDETVLLTFVYKNKKWSEKFSVNEKVIRVRAAVQRKTNIPLSRIALQFVSEENNNNNRTVLQDRHNLTHYSPENGSVIEVLQE
ncbi:hypothetical protein AGDE_09291 [Angomonas deanei]|nr:hypothetical protein AGDE_09291 [Angomonas deanei]|eukprot:EPY30737.1 hypothetical protein AGDE_09291 [Angomonas deanei]